MSRLLEGVSLTIAWFCTMLIIACQNYVIAFLHYANNNSSCFTMLITTHRNYLCVKRQEFFPLGAMGFNTLAVNLLLFNVNPYFIILFPGPWESRYPVETRRQSDLVFISGVAFSFASVCMPQNLFLISATLL